MFPLPGVPIGDSTDDEDEEEHVVVEDATRLGVAGQNSVSVALRSAQYGDRMGGVARSKSARLDLARQGTKRSPDTVWAPPAAVDEGDGCDGKVEARVGRGGLGGRRRALHRRRRQAAECLGIGRRRGGVFFSDYDTLNIGTRLVFQYLASLQ
jgi:hypothetical protein